MALVPHFPLAKVMGGTMLALSGVQKCGRAKTQKNLWNKKQAEASFDHSNLCEASFHNSTC